MQIALHALFSDSNDMHLDNGLSDFGHLKKFRILLVHILIRVHSNLILHAVFSQQIQYQLLRPKTESSEFIFSGWWSPGDCLDSVGHSQEEELNVLWYF